MRLIRTGRVKPEIVFTFLRTASIPALQYNMLAFLDCIIPVSYTIMKNDR
jgi:hypothetical protein